GIQVLAVELALRPRTVALLAEGIVPVDGGPIGGTGEGRVGIEAPDGAVAPGRIDELHRGPAVRLRHGSRSRGLRHAPVERVAAGGTFVAAPEGLGFRARAVLWDRHPPGHRFGVVKAQDAVRVVPWDVVVALVVAEAEVLPAVHGADVGERHPEALVAGA